jgi:uncharacterized tellurite resistance protein B-like protein
MPDESIERLKVAFTLAMARRIVNADATVHPDEVAAVYNAFPSSLLEGYGFMTRGDDGLTPAFHEAVKVAVAELPKRLSPEEKRQFIDWFRALSAADGRVDDREEALVKQAARILGVPQ